MSRVLSSFSVRQTALGSIVLALASVGAAGCGGKGERLKANVSAVEDAGLTVDPCNVDLTLVTEIFGCTPGKVVTDTQGNTRVSNCMDWEGHGTINGAPAGGAPTDGFVYPDSIVADPKVQAWFNAWTIPAGKDLTQVQMGQDAHCGSNGGLYAFHFLSYNEVVWGPQFGQGFGRPLAATGDYLEPVDISDWEGMAFWIKKGNDHPELEPTGSTLFVSLRDPNTMSLEQGGKLRNDKANNDREKCDPYGASVGFDTNWRYVMIPFSDMKQRGYGVREDALLMKQITKVTFSMDIGDAANGNWNVWIDDVVLYNYK